MVMKQGLRSNERVIIIGCDSGGLTAGSSLAPVLVLQEALPTYAHASTHIHICVYGCVSPYLHRYKTQTRLKDMFVGDCLCSAYSGGYNVHYTLNYETVGPGEQRTDNLDVLTVFKPEVELKM